MIHKTTRSILSVLLAALLLVTSTPLTPAFAGEEGAVSLQSESGEGRALEPVNGEYQIYTADDLKEFAVIVNGTDSTPADPDAHAKLMNDIDLSSVCGENIDGDPVSWIPIGNSYANAYTGTFDGNGKTISGLYINNSSDNYQGLFGYVSGTVQNLSVSGSVSGGMYVGGVVGRNNGGSVTGCAFSGSVSGNRYVGGVVGYNSSSTVTNCYNIGEVSGNRDVGGVVGYNSGSVTNCYNTGSVSGPDSGTGNRVGGVVGYNDGTVENCYNTGKVSGNSYVGGVVGDNVGIVKNCYNTGTVTGTDDYVGGVVGYISGGDGAIASVTNCYFLKTDDVNENLSGIGGDSGSEPDETPRQRSRRTLREIQGRSLDHQRHPQTPSAQR